MLQDSPEGQDMFDSALGRRVPPAKLGPTHRRLQVDIQATLDQPASRSLRARVNTFQSSVVGPPFGSYQQPDSVFETTSGLRYRST
jgi:hypothetical protein